MRKVSPRNYALCCEFLNYQKKSSSIAMAKLKFSLVRAVDEVIVIFNLVEVEIEVIDELSLLVRVGGVEKTN